jgi:hypothetical protein
VAEVIRRRALVVLVALGLVLAALAGACSSPSGSSSRVFDSAAQDPADLFTIRNDSGLVEGAPVPRVGTAPDGRPAMLFSVPGGGERAEVLPRVPVGREGQEIWVHYVAKLADVPVQTRTWQVILQWHQLADTGSPPIALEVGRGQLRLANVGTHQQSLGPVTANATVDVVLRIRFSQDPDTGLIEVWRNGREVLTDYHPPEGTLLDGADYVKMGIYRDPAIRQASSMAVTRLAIGPTAAAIDAPVG